jgi:hypothetical protein
MLWRSASVVDAGVAGPGGAQPHAVSATPRAVHRLRRIGFRKGTVDEWGTGDAASAGQRCSSLQMVAQIDDLLLTLL